MLVQSQDVCMFFQNFSWQLILVEFLELIWIKTFNSMSNLVNRLTKPFHPVEIHWIIHSLILLDFTRLLLFFFCKITFLFLIYCFSGICFHNVLKLRYFKIFYFFYHIPSTSNTVCGYSGANLQLLYNRNNKSSSLIKSLTGRIFSDWLFNTKDTTTRVNCMSKKYLSPKIWDENFF